MTAKQYAGISLSVVGVVGIAYVGTVLYVAWGEKQHFSAKR